VVARGEAPGFANGDFEINDSAPLGWIAAGQAYEDVNLSVDRRVFHQGKNSLRLSAKPNYSGGYATAVQTINATTFAGHKVRLRAYARGRDVKGRAEIWGRVQGAKAVGDGPGLGAGDCPLKGSFEWEECIFDLKVPDDAAEIQLGIGFVGSGTLWLDDVEIATLDP
jgi:hypothetical protein